MCLNLSLFRNPDFEAIMCGGGGDVKPVFFATHISKSYSNPHLLLPDFLQYSRHTLVVTPILACRFTLRNLDAGQPFGVIIFPVKENKSLLQISQGSARETSRVPVKSS